MARRSGEGNELWLVLNERFSARVFFECGIVASLQAELGDRLRLILLMPRVELDHWRQQIERSPVLEESDLFPVDVPAHERALRRLDQRLDRWIGFYPLAIRLNYRHGFHLERMEPGHPNRILDSSRKGPLPRWRWLDPLLTRWYLTAHRYVPTATLERLRRSCASLAFANVQAASGARLLAAARRLDLPVVGNVASWDHTVGKGVLSPHLDRYIVQNRVMRDDLARYHSISAERVTISGWPQTDVFQRPRPRADYEQLLSSYGLAPARPLVLVMGNSPSNAPYEGRLVERLVHWWKESPQRERLSLLFRPHPRDREWEERFAAALAEPGVHVQQPSYFDMDVLATLLQHASCVVTNAGTVLLDSLVNDRPAVCVLYDEGAPAGESWALKNVSGLHYRQLMESEAFFRAHAFDEVVAGVEQALARPQEHAAERRRVAAEVVGEVDGRAGGRVATEILKTLRRP